MKRLYLIILTAILLISCGSGKSEYISKEKLFDLNYGKFEDEIDLTQKKTLDIPVSTDLIMKDGIIYILNGNLQKIMKFNSFGDLLSVIMKKELNPEPVIVENENSSELISNRKGIYFSFNNASGIAVDSNQNIYVSDLLPSDRQEWDEDNNTMLTGVVYRFDNSGNYSDFIGQDGPGGMPFPYITELQTNSLNELIVVSKTASSIPVYWFSSTGRLLYQIEINNNSIPSLDEENVTVYVDSVNIPESDHKLFIKCDFYKKIINSQTGKETDVDYLKSAVYVLNLDSGSFDSVTDIPEVFTSSSDNISFSEERLQVTYNTLGIAGNDNIFLTSIVDENSYKLLILNTNGNVIYTTKLNTGDQPLNSIDFDLDNKGIITSILSGTDKSSVVWWRTDRIIKEK